MNRIIFVVFIMLFLFANTAFAKQGTTGGGGWKGNIITSPDDFPSRIAGDSGTASGDWGPIPYTDASNATDGDYSTFAYGSATGDGKESYVTWDMGAVFDISIVTVKADISGSVKGSLIMQGIQDNIFWWKLADPHTWFVTTVLPETEPTFLSKYRIRYIRFRHRTNESDPSNVRIYEIKVR